ncbi:DUF1003 domain-containing protein (plasmid) [Ensifer adhaerens]|uniref:DUF1003 domain-containing protein n=1 Tax=Ensifer adhaerens TaxID=106592 RepID=UPI001CBBD2BD|nr:DUF1003 domain-containing protein [Ensifer adhaerens]MBZ7927201.1 DUF1003 domain-containing protein [Ensifer adhaerens]UAX98233.1 DUF1003 domain-containing protein [Ensifer adhaerens]UAY05615.1 DUF1003 domain-containing protein [Ensifer adhaerens]UAY12993.1 DUF1003 domain-containing protein [Ensifer adhaerens]
MASTVETGGTGATDTSDGEAQLERNIRAILRRRSQQEQARTTQDRVAQGLTRFAGSMTFVYLHVAIFGAWIVTNLGILPGSPVFDPTFAVLAMVASVEAIFISTFVLISQNRMANRDDERDDLNLQISLLAEQEATHVLTLVSAIAERLGVSSNVDGDIGGLASPTTPEEVIVELERHKRKLED